MAIALDKLSQPSNPGEPPGAPRRYSVYRYIFPRPPGQKPPAPNANPGTPADPPNLDTRGRTDADRHMNEMPGHHREANDNIPATLGGGAAPPPGYPNTGGSK